MPEHKNKSFRDKKLIEKIKIVAGIGLLIILLASFVLGIYFFGIAGAFKLLGVEYYSIWSILGFVISFYILGVIVELFTIPIFNHFVQDITGKIKLFFLRISFEGLTNWLVLFTVDEFMHSITLSLQTEMIIAILVAVLEKVFDMEKDKDADKDLKLNRKNKMKL